MKPTEQAWNKLAHSAARAPETAMELPLGFATRVVANWKAQTAEALLNTMESLTWRSLAVAMVILLGTAALGYDALSGFISGDATVPGDIVPALSYLLP
jgi:hypothetical protein